MSVDRKDDGLTLIELLVSITLLSILGGIVLTLLQTTQSTAKAGKQEQDTNEEARLAMNRVARELRQAVGILSVRNPDGAGYNPQALTAITFAADFNLDGCISDGGAGAPTACVSPAPTTLSTSDPEVLTYCYQPVLVGGVLDAASSRVFLRGGTLPTGATSCSQGAASTVPLLAGNVTSFKFTYRSNEYLYDVNPADGVTSWNELDQAGPPIGNSDGLLDAPDLTHVDSVLIDMSLLEGKHRQDYQTQVDLRNLSR